MNHNSAMLNSRMPLPGPRPEDVGVREERYRMNIGKKIRCLVREMDRSPLKVPVCDSMKCRDILSKIRRRIDEKSRA